MNDCAKTSVREKISSQLVGQAMAISEQAERYATETEERLSVVQLPTSEGGNNKPNGPPLEPWPPLFGELREILMSIERNLGRIRAAVRAAEI